MRAPSSGSPQKYLYKRGNFVCTRGLPRGGAHRGAGRPRARVKLEKDSGTTPSKSAEETMQSSGQRTQIVRFLCVCRRRRSLTPRRPVAVVPAAADPALFRQLVRPRVSDLQHVPLRLQGCASRGRARKERDAGRRELLLLPEIHDLARDRGEHHARHPAGRAHLPRCVPPNPNHPLGKSRTSRSVQVEQDGDVEANDLEPPADAVRRDGLHVLRLPAALRVRGPRPRREKRKRKNSGVPAKKKNAGCASTSS